MLDAAVNGECGHRDDNYCRKCTQNLVPGLRFWNRDELANQADVGNDHYTEPELEIGNLLLRLVYLRHAVRLAF